MLIITTKYSGAMVRSYILTNVDEVNFRRYLAGEEDSSIWRKEYKTPKSLARAIIKYYTPVH